MAIILALAATGFLLLWFYYISVRVAFNFGKIVREEEILDAQKDAKAIISSASRVKGEDI